MKQASALTRKISFILETAGIPSAVIAYASRGKLVYNRGFGSILGREVTPQFVYDCASLTKPLVTTLLFLMLEEEGLLSVDAELGDFQKLFPEPLRGLGLTNLLTHTSGIRPWYPLYTEGLTLPEYVEATGRLSPLAVQGEEVHYSCLNFVLLAHLLEHFSGTDFVTLAERRLFRPLSLNSTALGKSTAQLSHTAPTEHGAEYERRQVEQLGLAWLPRRGLIHGKVHDCNAYHCSSRSGNAGLFSTSADLLRLMEQFTSRSQLLSEESRQLIHRYDTPGKAERRSLGWQWSSSPGCGAGTRMSASSIGHSGFTGTSIWHDFHSHDTFIILTNRIYPRVTDMNMNEVRRQIHQTIADELDLLRGAF